MSACSSTVRAVSRSRVSPLKTLLPFLYQTTTIQRCFSTTRPIARHSITPRSLRSNGDEIPFVDEHLPPPIDQGPARKTTITGTERIAFKKLYKKFNKEEREQKVKDIVELGQIRDEYYEEDEENSKPSLDELFDEVMKGEPRLRSTRSAKEPTAETYSGEARGTRKKGAGFDATQLRDMRLAERERIDKLIRNAATDRDLWDILDREVLTKVRELDLDNISTGGRRAPAAGLDSNTSAKNATLPKPTSRPDPPSPEQRVLFKNYPHHLITAIDTLRSEFPSSLLPFSILPMVKSLGRSSHALGATTTLYKHLLRTAWIQQGSYTTIDTLLTEMDNNAIEFDPDILALLDTILREYNQARSGILGREIQMVYSMEMFADEVSKILSWRKTVAERLGMKSEEIRLSNRLVRAVPQSRGAHSDTLDPHNGASSQREEQDNVFDTEGGSSEGNEGSRDDNPLAQGADLSSTGVDRASEVIPSAEGDAAGEVDGPENSSTIAEESNEQKQEDENPHAPGEPPKITL